MSTIYQRLSNWPLVRKSYPAKFMLIAFIGIHVPLIILSICLVFNVFSFSKGNAVLIVLIATLLATIIALYTFYQLLSPLHRSKQALQDYLLHRELPHLPVTHTDEAGVLMKEIQHTLTTLNTLIEEKKDIAYLLSHDLRTPLTQFVGLGQLLQREEGKNRVHEIADIMIKVGQQQLTFLNSILELMSYNDLECTESFQSVSLDQVTSDAIRNVTQMAAAKNIQIQKDFSAGLTFSGNAEAFTQVLQNLLTNAIKFSQPGSSVYVHATRQNEKLHISVTDEGLGFDLMEASLLFNRYTAARKEGTAGEASTGIGLYLVRKIVEQHKGTITAHSNGVNTGASFLIHLP